MFSIGYSVRRFATGVIRMKVTVPFMPNWRVSLPVPSRVKRSSYSPLRTVPPMLRPSKPNWLPLSRSVISRLIRYDSRPCDCFFSKRPDEKSNNHAPFFTKCQKYQKCQILFEQQRFKWPPGLLGISYFWKSEISRRIDFPPDN